MRCTRLGLVLLVAIATTGLVVSRADDPPQGAPTPTAQHKLLSKDVGTWDASIKLWMGGPNSEPTESKGVETNTMLGGFWLVGAFKGDIGGQPFEGRGQVGYDTNKKKYVTTWIDTMSSEVMLLEGDLDEKTHILTMTGKGTGPDGKPYEAKEVSEHKGDDTRVFTMYMKSDQTNGEMAKMMEITYTRRK
jgi:hypothetical protein